MLRAALISVLIVLPFIVLEFLNNALTRQNAPGLAVLFTLLWLLSTGFFSAAFPVVRDVRAGTVMAHPAMFYGRVAFALIVAAFWGVIVADQMPCFLGVPNCD